MGQFRFIVPQRDEGLTRFLIERSYVAGRDGIPYRGRVYWSEGLLILERRESESGRIHTPWPDKSIGQIMLGTTQLIERSRPYLLPLELARGTIFRVRTTLASMSQFGIPSPPNAEALLRRAFASFTSAVTNQNDSEQVAPYAEAAIGSALAAARQTGMWLADYILRLRLEQNNNLFVALTSDEIPSDLVKPPRSPMINAVMVPVDWRRIEPRPSEYHWDELDQLVEQLENNELLVGLGPLIRFEEECLPEWFMENGQRDGQRECSCLDWIETIVKRYAGRVLIWNCVASVLSNYAVNVLGEDAVVSVIAGAIETSRAADRKGLRIITIDDPWVSQAAKFDVQYAPTSTVQSLWRARTGLSAILLTFRIGYRDGDSFPRDLIAIQECIDRWSALRIPIIVDLDVAGMRSGAVLPINAAQWKSARSDSTQGLEGSRQYVKSLVRILACQPMVNGVFWRPAAPGSFQQLLNEANPSLAAWDETVWTSLASLPLNRPSPHQG